VPAASSLIITGRSSLFAQLAGCSIESPKQAQRIRFIPTDQLPYLSLSNNSI